MLYSPAITNLEKKHIGFWIRPDQDLSGTHYDKLVLQDAFEDNVLHWQTEDKLSSYEELSTDSFVLNFNKSTREWSVQSSDPASNIPIPQVDGDFNGDELMEYDGCGIVTRKFLKEDICSMKEELERYDLSWQRMRSVNELLFENYDAEDIVWRVQKRWTHDGQYVKSDTVECTIWLSDFNVLSDGTQVWSSTGISSIEYPEYRSKVEVPYIEGTLARKAEAAKPYQTTLWTADIQKMFLLPTKLAALYNATQLLLSYIDNNPLEIKYVIADAISRDEFEALLKEEQ